MYYKIINTQQETTQVSITELWSSLKYLVDKYRGLTHGCNCEHPSEEYLEKIRIRIDSIKEELDTRLGVEDSTQTEEELLKIYNQAMGKDESGK